MDEKHAASSLTTAEAMAIIGAVYGPGKIQCVGTEAEVAGFQRRVYGQRVAMRPATRPRPAARSRSHARERRPGSGRRSGASSRTSSSDPGDDGGGGDSDHHVGLPPSLGGEVRRIPAQLPLYTESLTADCRLCGEPAVPGLLVCRACWGYALTLATARFMLDEQGRAA
jgi:hypothetical protein